MKIVIAPDSFKGSLTSLEVISYVKQSAATHFEDIEIIEVPIADGGDGTVEALVYATNGSILNTQARDPLNRMKNCIYGSASGSAIIGLSECSGLASLTQTERNPLETSSHGTGDIIKEALDDGFSNIVVGIGGSATNDCGSGAMQVLGLKFLRADGSLIERMCGKELRNIASVDDSCLDTRLKDTNITIMCDVTNPLTGKNGATYIYGPQKGADEKMLEILESGMLNYEKLLNAYAKKNITEMPGTGAAGGIGCALHCYAGAKLCRGIDTVLNLVEFDKVIADADLVITGEGRIDYQSAFGKVVHGVAGYAKAANIPVVVIAGSIGDGAQAVFPLGVKAIIPLPNEPMSLESCISNAGPLIKSAADRAFSLIKIGQSMQK